MVTQRERRDRWPVRRTEQPVPWSLNPDLRFLWSFRPDVCGDAAIESAAAEDTFVAWWLIHGWREYPFLAATLERSGSGTRLRRRAFSPCAASPRDGTPPFIRLMNGLWHLDPKTRAAFDISRREGRNAYRRWFWTRGLAFYLAHQTLPRLAGQALKPFGRGCDQTSTASFRAGGAVEGVNLIGYARGELGIGEDLRMVARACRTAGIAFSVFDVGTGPGHRQNDFSVVDRLSKDCPYPVNIICLTGIETAMLGFRFGERLLHNRYNIGYWPWELPRWPELWNPALTLVDEVWVSSDYTRQAFAQGPSKPIFLMPMAVDVPSPAPKDRRAFDLPEDAFLFLFTFDWQSYPARKNPGACVAAFRRAFPSGHEPVRLVLKVMGASPADPRFQGLMAEIGADPRLRVINQVLDRDELVALTAACDAVVSLHRAEGFGRTLAEAMILGKPVVATGWSGNVDFCTPETAIVVPARTIPVGAGDYPGGNGLWWADPDINAAAAGMRRIVEDAALRARITGAAAALIRARHGAAAVGERYRARLEAIAEAQKPK